MSCFRRRVPGEHQGHGLDGASLIQNILSRLRKVKQRSDGKNWDACCPAHEDRTPSLSIGIGEDGRVLLHCQKGCETAAIVQAMGLNMTDLFPSNGEKTRSRIVATYDYRDETGKLLYQAVRFEPKDFRQRKPIVDHPANDCGDDWDWSIAGTRRVLYRLPELLVEPSKPVWIVEGEKDVESLRGLGLVATTNAMGAGKWRGEYNPSLIGRVVYIIPDNDHPGRLHAEQVRRELEGTAASIKIVRLPEDTGSKDASDWIASGGTREQLESLARVPEPQPETKRTSAEPTWLFQLDGEILADGTPESVLSEFETDKSEEDQTRFFELHTLGCLMNINYPEPVWVVKDLLSEGLNILAGAPKQGKSMLALNLGLTVAGGGMALGNVKVECGDVLYLSLEDKDRRVKKRAIRMLEGIDADLRRSVEKRLTIVTDWPRQDEGGLKLLDLWVKKVEKPVLIIIDVWNRFSPEYKQSGNAYSQDARFLGEVKRYADRNQITVLIIHHTRKPSGTGKEDDYVHGVSGTMGLTGAADGIAVLIRARQENQATLSVTGRDVPETELVLEFNPETLTWRSLGTTETHVEGKVRTAVYDYLRALPPKGKAFCNEIAEAVEQKPDSVRRALNRLKDEGKVRKVGNAWAYPAEERYEIP